MNWDKTLNELIGAPFAWGGRGESGNYDCWGLTVEVLRRMGLNVTLEFAPRTQRDVIGIIDEQTAGRGWKKVAVPEVGDVAVLGNANNRHHVGVVTPVGILHTLRRAGAVIQQPLDLRLHGYRLIEYYRWVE